MRENAAHARSERERVQRFEGLVSGEGVVKVTLGKPSVKTKSRKSSARIQKLAQPKHSVPKRSEVMAALRWSDGGTENMNGNSVGVTGDKPSTKSKKKAAPGCSTDGGPIRRGHTDHTARTSHLAAAKTRWCESCAMDPTKQPEHPTRASLQPVSLTDQIMSQRPCDHDTLHSVRANRVQHGFASCPMAHIQAI